jgi:CRP-like cAMP-binding protein
MSAVSGNALLSALSPAVLAELDPREQKHPIGLVLIKPDEVPAQIFFPHHGAMASIVRSAEDGGTIEAGVIGNEGLFHVQTAITTPATTGNQALVQSSGTFSAVDAGVFRRLFSEDAEMRTLVLSFTASYIEQLSQNLLCNRLHAIEERLAKWLLLVRDRINNDDLELTHEFLGHMLGVHRPGVTIAVQALTLAGLIDHSRGLIHIRDLAALRLRSCNCYVILERSYRTFCDSIGPAYATVPTLNL